MAYMTYNTHDIHHHVCVKIINNELKNLKDQWNKRTKAGNPLVLVKSRKRAKALGIDVRQLDWVYYHYWVNRPIR